MSVVTSPDPRRVLGQLDDAHPFVLLPLRLETRFVGEELWIRAYPDQIAITAHEPSLTDAEVRRGRAFWTASWGGDPDTTRNAWRALAAGGPLRRALWIARQTRPTNTPPAAPSFPPVDTKPTSWSAAPHVDVMPDQLVFTLLVNGTVVHQPIGARIPSPLVVGPDPVAAMERAPDGSLLVGDAMKWVVDFDAAEAAGMAIKIPLGTGPQAFDRLVVVGVKLAQAAGAPLEALLQAHRYSDGLQLVPQGMPTNHTDAAIAGATNDDVDAAFARELGGPLFTSGVDVLRSDGERLAAALGVADTTLDHLREAGRRDVEEAIAMNRALWPATLGYFAEQMMAGVVDEPTREVVRDLGTKHVRGRGALPAVMVGAQPYGVLPTTAFSRWQAMPSEPSQLAAVDHTIQTLATTWAALVANVTHVGGASDPDRALFDILGLQASSVAFQQRRAVGPEYVWNLATFQGSDPHAHVQAHQTAATALLHGLNLTFATNPRILDLELVRTHVVLSGATVSDAPLSEERALDPNYIEWLRGKLDAIRTESYTASPPRTLLYVLLRRAILLGAWEASTTVLVASGLATAEIRVEAELVNVRETQEPTRWDHLEVKLPAVTGALAVGDFVRTSQSGAAGAVYREQLDALAVLAPLPTARLERLVAEHIDLCSYRLDAWRLGRVAQRLETMRATRRDGSYIGAYGWLEAIHREVATGSSGYVHAPSLAHATAAAILRSGYETHTDPAARERMAIDLSSERVRRALRYLDGLRQGQDLAALLGFRFERGLHDANPTLALDQYVQQLRRFFPLVAGRVVAGDEPIEAVEARNVVDGTRLLMARSLGYPYGVAGLPAGGSAAALAIATQMDRLADDMDAIADLSLAESIYQAAQGKQERACAFANGLAMGTPPPDPEIVATPRSGTGVTHRICVLISSGASSASSWSGTTPRSRFEPALDRWLGQLLGDPATLRVRVVVAGTVGEVRFDELAIQPIDLVSACGQPHDVPGALARQIEAVVRVRDGVAADARVELRWSERDPSWPATVRSLFEAMPLLTALSSVIRSRPLDAPDLDVEAGETGHDLAELGGRVTATIAALGAAIASHDSAQLAPWLAGTAVAELANPTEADLVAVHDRAAALAASAATLDTWSAIAKLLFGSAFVALPRFVVTNDVELGQALGAPALLAGALPFAVDEWLQGVARVQPRAAAYETVRLLAESFGVALEPPTLAQLPFAPAAPWLGLEGTPTPTHDGRALSLVVHAVGRPDLTAPITGFLVDELVELIPNASEVTAVAFQHSRPTSEPPQSLLVVVPSATRGGWQWADLLGAVMETLDLAKARAVEPSALAGTGYAQFLPALIGPVASQPVTITMDLERLA